MLFDRDSRKNVRGDELPDPLAVFGSTRRVQEWLDTQRFNADDRQWLKDFHISL